MTAALILSMGTLLCPPALRLPGSYGHDALSKRTGALGNARARLPHEGPDPCAARADHLRDCLRLRPAADARPHLDGRQPGAGAVYARSESPRRSVCAVGRLFHRSLSRIPRLLARRARSCPAAADRPRAVRFDPRSARYPIAAPGMIVPTHPPARARTTLRSVPGRIVTRVAPVREFL